MTSLFFRNACLIASPSICEPVLVYRVLHDLAVSDLLHGAVLAGVDVEPVQTPSVYQIPSYCAELESDKSLPIRLVILGREIALLDHTVLLREVGFGECLS